MAPNDQSKKGLLSENPEDRHSFDEQESDSGSDLDATEFLYADPLDNNDGSQSYSTSTKAKTKAAAGSKARSLLRWFQWIPLRVRKPRSRCCMIALILCFIVILIFIGGGGFAYKKIVQEPPYGQSPPWYPSPRGGTVASWAESYKKAAAMVQRMTLAEKVNVTTGTGWMMGLAVGTTGPATNVGFPQLNLQDGPLGLRFADNATAFPAGITVGATWNKELMYQRGRAHAIEARGKGLQVLLGPCVGPLGRMPAGGRNWEGFGSDPYLQGVASAHTVSGIQSEGIMATIKHFVGNEQEHFRQQWEWGIPHAISSNIDDRTLHELYAWPFGDAIKAGVASVMCSYNMVNNSYVCGNSKLLNGILKDEMGFQGFVMSDWLAQRSGVASALAGLDMSMPGDGLRWMNGQSLWGPELSRAVLNGSLPVDRLNDMVTRVVASWYQLGQDSADFDNSGPNFSSWTKEKMGTLAPGSKTSQESIEVNKFVNVQSNHSELARQIAAEGTVLLKNVDNCLPLGTDGVTGSKKPKAKRDDKASGAAAAETTAKVKISIIGEDAGPGPSDDPNACNDRGCNQGTLASGWGSGAVEFPYLVTPVDALKEAFDKDKVELTISLGDRASEDDYAEQDVCIVFANSDGGEGYIAWGGISGDRNDLLLQKGGDDLVYTVALGCGGGHGEVIVVVHAVGPVVMERWIDLPNVKAVLYANLPGEESGNALADVLFGKTNPSGKLPYTIGKSLDDYGDGGKVMYIPNQLPPQQDFTEGLYIDYRHFDKQKIAPRFAFGYGLSYSNFVLGNLTVKEILPKSALPAARPAAGATPPEYDTKIPDAKEALFPQGFRKLAKYIYPYLDKVDDITAKPGSYPYPEGYDVVQTPSGAGGEEGGNPDLWETYVRVILDVRNVSPLKGQAVVQLYLGYPEGAEDAAGVDFPVKVLRGFDKVELEAHESQQVMLDVTRRDLSYWSVQQQNWVMVTGGQYTLMVGQSSDDLPLQAKW